MSADAPTRSWDWRVAVGFTWALLFNGGLGARLGVFYYGRVIPGLALFEGTKHQYPVYDAVAMALQMSVFAYLLGRTDAEGRKRFRGVLAGVEGDQVGIDLEGEDETAMVPFAWIVEAKLVLTDALMKRGAEVRAQRLAAESQTSEQQQQQTSE